MIRTFSQCLLSSSFVRNFCYLDEDEVKKKKNLLFALIEEANVLANQPWASLPMGTPPRQKSNRVESSTESGKLLKIASRVLDF